MDLALNNLKRVDMPLNKETKPNQPEVWKTRKFNDWLLRYYNTVYNQNTIERWTKGCIFLFPKKDNLRITKNYQGITFTSITTKIYYALLLNCIEPEIEKILRKNQNGFQWNWSTISQILTIHQILGIHAKSLEATLFFFYRFLQGIWLHI